MNVGRLDGWRVEPPGTRALVGVLVVVDAVCRRGKVGGVAVGSLRQTRRVVDGVGECLRRRAGVEVAL